jgi:hypothetical protein
VASLSAVAGDDDAEETVVVAAAEAWREGEEDEEKGLEVEAEAAAWFVCVNTPRLCDANDDAANVPADDDDALW